MECLELWLESLFAQGASPRTVQNYRESVGAFIRYLESDGEDPLLQEILEARTRRGQQHFAPLIREVWTLARRAGFPRLLAQGYALPAGEELVHSYLALCDSSARFSR
jgi:hypothetical protein